MKNIGKLISKQRVQIWLGFLVIIGIIGNIARCNSLEIGRDEAYSMLLSRGSFSYMVEETAADVHPPLYYIILKCATLLIGENIFLLRVLSVIPIIALLLIGLTFVRRQFGGVTSTIFIVLVSFPPSISARYNTELRMYSYAMAFIVVCVLFAYCIYTRNNSNWKLWIGFVGTGIAAAYLHYYALVTVAFIYIGLFFFLIIEDRKRIKECIIYSFITILLYIPWLPILIQQFNKTTENYWIGPITKSILKGYYRFTFGSEIVGLIFGLMTILFFVITFATQEGIQKSKIWDQNGAEIKISWKWIRKLSPSKKLVLLCIAGFFGNIFTGVTLSLIFRPIFSERYIYVGIGLLWLAIGIMATEAIKSMKWFGIFFVLFLLFAGVGNFREIYKSEQTKSADTMHTIGIMQEQISPDDIIISNIQHFTWTILQYFFPDNYVKVVHDINWEETDAVIWYLEGEESILIPNLVKENKWTTENIGQYSINETNFSLYKIVRQ